MLDTKHYHILFKVLLCAFLIVTAITYSKEQHCSMEDRDSIVTNANEDSFEIRKEIITKGKVVKYKSDYSFGQFLNKLRADENVLNKFVTALQESPFHAYFFETPKVNRETLDTTKFEFVLVNTERFEDVDPDSGAFREHFDKCKRGKFVTSFANLGGDAGLVAPCPHPESKNDGLYSHLASFVRAAPQVQVFDFWKESARSALYRINQRGSKWTWISTSGLGIYWLHLRLDSRPKYYTYHPYTT
jgi:hypothetical protein